MSDGACDLGAGGSAFDFAQARKDPPLLAVQLRRVNWLTLRSTYSSWAHEKEVPGKVIARLMGHAKVDTTLNVYTQ